MKSFKTENTVSFYFSKRETMQSNIRLTTAGSIYPGYVIDEIVEPMSKTIAAPNTKVLALIGIRLDFDQFSCQFFDKDGAIIVDEEYAIELAKELEENEGKMNIQDEDYSFVTLFFCKQGQCDKYTHPLQKEETEDADVAEEYNDKDDAENINKEMPEEATEESVLTKRNSSFLKRPTNLFACFKFSNARDICSVYRLLGVNAKYCKIYYNDKNWYITVDKKKCTYNYCTNLYFLFTEYNGIDRNRYGAYLAEHCTPVSIEQVRLFAL